MGQINLTTEQLQEFINNYHVYPYYDITGGVYQEPFALANTYYPIKAPLVDGDLYGFTLNGDPEYNIEFTGDYPVYVEFRGVSDIGITAGTDVDITFSLFKDSGSGYEIQDKFKSTVTVSKNGDKQSIQTVGEILLNKGDKLQVHGQATSATTLEIVNLKLGIKTIHLA